MKRDPILTEERVLPEREGLILNCVVESYVQAAKPVGSRYLAKRFQLGLSPATIRNVMNDLEEKGYLSQPHRSAGRIPTDSGYRFYVDSLKLVQTLSRNDRRIILESLRNETIDASEIFETASRILAKISSQLGVVLEPSFQQGIFEKMELVPVAERKILAVISIRSGLVRTILMEVDVELTREHLDQAAGLINERLSGLPLQEIKESIDKRLYGATTSKTKYIVLLIAKSSNRLFSFDDQDDLHLGGAGNIVLNPEFSSDTEYTVRILELIEGKQGILTQFNEIASDDLSVSIGRENRSDLLCNCSIISARYHVGDVSGALGVVGPTRLHYPKMISLVEYMGKVLTRQLDSTLSS